MIVEDYEALKCRYPSKKCWNQRAVKRNGERHNLCEMHRQKANNNQRRLDKKRKAGHMLKGEPGSIGGEHEVPELDYHTQAVLAHQHQQRLLHQQQQQQQQHLHHSHHHSHPYHRPAPQQQMLHPQQLSLLQRQQALSQHYHQQQEKRLRVSLTNMYAAAQALSPHRLSPLPSQQQHSPPPSHELAPLRSTSSAAAAPRPVLHLPPLTSHIPTRIGKDSSRSSSPQAPQSASTTSPPATAMKPSLSPQLTAKPTILLPPITSVPRCHQMPFQLPLAGGGAATNTSWRSEEKAHLAK